MTANGPGYLHDLYRALRTETEKLFDVRCVHDEGDPSQVLYFKRLMYEPDLHLVIYVANIDASVEITALLTDDGIGVEDEGGDSVNLVLDLNLATVLSVYKVTDVPESEDEAKAMARGLASVTQTRIFMFCNTLTPISNPTRSAPPFPGLRMGTAFVHEVAKPRSPSYPGRGGDA